MVTGGWITQADRSRWQQRAAGELAAILAAHPGHHGDRVDRHRIRRRPVRPGPRPPPQAGASCSASGGRPWPNRR
jgi:hypothetical protein